MLVNTHINIFRSSISRVEVEELEEERRRELMDGWMELLGLDFVRNYDLSIT